MNFPPARERIIIRSVDPQLVEQLAKDLTVSPLVARILASRGLSTFDECKKFFRIELSQLHDPFRFRDMEKAVARIRDAIDKKEKIMVYGDYDADGVTATAVLIKVLREFGATCDYFLPNRLIEGYGISSDSLRGLARDGARLLISVDCGITAVDEAEIAADVGLDFIITDHHEPKDNLPRALAIIDPKIPGCTYPETTLAGVGVALKLCQALTRRMNAPDEIWQQHLDLVALGTAADIVPLTGENRIIAKVGFDMVRRTTNAGLAALLKLRQLSDKPLSTSEIVFSVAPCLNAVGRLGDPRRGVELLLTRDTRQAAVYAQELLDANTERRAIDAQVQKQAFAWIETNCSPATDFAIIAASEDWHRGVIGIVASKIVDRYHRPAILFSIGSDGIAKGSGRSVPGFHLLDALKECEDLLEGYGGHAVAAGVTIRSDRIEEFRARFNTVAMQRLSLEELSPSVHADAEATMHELTPKLITILKQMEPFGPGNMRPVFVSHNLRNRDEPRMVGDNHVKMKVTDGAIVMDAIAFGFGPRINEIRTSNRFSLAFSLDENEWNGSTTLQLKVKGVAA